MMTFKCNQLSEAIKGRNDGGIPILRGDYNDIQLQFFDTFPFFSKGLRICVRNVSSGYNVNTQHARVIFY